MSKINLKICGITNKTSVQRAYENKIKSLGFASNNLNGPNTVNDKMIKKLIKECNYYKIESVLLTKNYSLNEIIKQIDFTKPKTISCSYHFHKNDLREIKKIFKKWKIIYLYKKNLITIVPNNKFNYSTWSIVAKKN